MFTKIIRFLPPKNSHATALPVALLLCVISIPVSAQISVNPNGLNVSTQAPTAAFLTFGNLNNQVPAEATWCGELIPAAPDIGQKCNPATIFGVIPARYERGRPSGNNAFTDIMSIPASVARRAYQAASDGSASSFFFVRRFVSTVGGRDEYVVVTCRMTGGDANSPFSLTNVEMAFTNTNKPIVFAREGEPLPKIKAVISYTGAGRLKGRWEVVKPGEELPDSRDLLTEATLPIEQRGQQRRYTQLSRFNVFLQPNGKYMLEGPEIKDLPAIVAGEYLVLLRIEASDNDVSVSNLAAVGAGPGVVNSGAVAGFPMPVLRYFIGPGTSGSTNLVQLAPGDAKLFSDTDAVDFAWMDLANAAVYRLELVDANGKPILSALLPSRTGTYRAPSWVPEKTNGGALRWRVLALDGTGNQIGESTWRTVRFAGAARNEKTKP